MNNKRIARYAHAFIGGKPNVSEYYNDNKSKTIDIMTCIAENASKDTSVSTIGLSSIDIDRTLDGVPLRVELLIAGRAEKEEYANILASAAFVIQEGKTCDFGMIINDVVTPYVKNTDLAHVVLLHPVFWEDYAPLEVDDTVVAWLLAVPITDIEKEFILRNGIDEFDEILGKSDVDVTDLTRSSCI